MQPKGLMRSRDANRLFSGVESTGTQSCNRVYTDSHSTVFNKYQFYDGVMEK